MVDLRSDHSCNHPKIMYSFFQKIFFVLALFCANATMAQTPTWSNDIACIVNSHCTPCHRPDGPGHFDLIDHADAYYWRNEMQAATSSRFMPPWPPDQEYNSLAHERTLTQDEIDLISAWVQGGAPEGDPANTPPPPVFTSNEQITDPDISVTMEEFVIPASSADLYRCFVLEVDNPTDRFITAMEVIPGNTSMVHHVLVFQDTTGEARALDDQDITPGYTSFGGIGVSSAKLIGAWVPGEQAFYTPQGMGIKLFANADIVIQVHYPATSSSESDATKLNLQMSDAPFLRNLAIDAVLEHTWTLTNGPLIIAPNEVKSFHSQFQVPFPSTIISIAPHAHLVCTSMKSYAVLPSGDTIPLIDIPNWDFRWQGHYLFRSPIHLPTGTMLHGEATYDNTANNPFNPNSPPDWVFLGEATTNEMMLFYFAWTLGTPADENMVIDDSEHMEHHLDCVPQMQVGISETDRNLQLKTWPSPANDVLYIDAGDLTGEAELFDGVGRKVKQFTIRGQQVSLSVDELSPGQYLLKFTDRRGNIARSKVVLE